jgi:predicted neuraminidase
VHGIIETKFLYNPGNQSTFCHAPSLLETTSGDLLVAWYIYPEVEHKDAQLALVRRPKEKLWETAKTISDHQAYSEGNPVLFEEPGGRIWLFFVALKGIYWTDAELNARYSEDGGRSWSPAQRLWEKHGMMVRHPPVLLKSGALALPAYDEVGKEAVILTANPPYQDWEILFKFTGLELLQPVLIRMPGENDRDPDSTGTQIAQTKGKHPAHQTSGSQLTLFFRPWSDPRVIWRSHSDNEGRSWSTPLRTPLPNPLSGISAFSAGGHMAVAHNHTYEHHRYPLSISISRNRGVSWENPRHIDTIEHEVSYPSFLNGYDNIVHGVYTYNRRMIKYVSIQEMSLLEMI